MDTQKNIVSGNISIVDLRLIFFFMSFEYFKSTSVSDRVVNIFLDTEMASPML